MPKIHAAGLRPARGDEGSGRSVDSSSGISRVPEAAPCADPGRGHTRVCPEPAPWRRGGKYSLPDSQRVPGDASLHRNQKLQERSKQSPRHLLAHVCLLISTDKADDDEINS